MAKGSKTARRTLLAAARAHEDALRAAGLARTALERYENALRAVAMQAREADPKAQVLLCDIRREIEEFQAAIRKEFPGDAAVQASFKAREPVPQAAREVLALGRHVARDARGHAASLIKYALNTATVRHLDGLCDQLENELGGADPARDLRTVEEEILSAARSAFAGRPELLAFARSESGLSASS
ncbi:MAG TPA: hypothetical protein VFA79_09345 [Myxococcales bacterium]|nr:hypothetical protein [Myxococcales bacterium]